MSNVASIVQPPRYRRHKGSGQAVVTINGRDIYLGKYRSASSHELYRRIVAQWLHDGGRLPDHSPVTVGKVMVAYLGFAKSYYVKNGKRTREFELIRETAGSSGRSSSGYQPSSLGHER